MRDHIKEAQEELKLARLLRDRLGAESELAREETRECLNRAQDCIDMAFDDLDTADRLQGFDDSE